MALSENAVNTRYLSYKQCNRYLFNAYCELLVENPAEVQTNKIAQMRGYFLCIHVHMVDAESDSGACYSLLHPFFFFFFFPERSRIVVSSNDISDPTAGA